MYTTNISLSQANTSNLWFIGGETCDGLGDNAYHRILYILIKSWHWNRMQYYGGKNTCINNRMLYAKKVRLSLALLTGLEALLVKVRWGNLDSWIYRYPNNNRRTNKQQAYKRCNAQSWWHVKFMQWYHHII